MRAHICSNFGVKKVWGSTETLEGSWRMGTEEHSAEKLGLVTDTLVSTEGRVRVEQAPGSIDSKESHKGQTRGESMHAASPSTGFSGRLLVKTGTASLPTVAPIPTNVLSVFSARPWTPG